MTEGWTASIDCRPGGPVVRLLEPGTIRKPVLAPDNGEVPVGEIIILIGGMPVHVVAEETGRDCIELTLEMVSTAERSADYRRVFLAALC